MARSRSEVLSLITCGVLLYENPAIENAAIFPTSIHSCRCGIALGTAGNSTFPMRLAEDLSERFPQNTGVEYNSLPAIRAVTALTSGDPIKAVAALVGQADQDVSFALYPVYLRGMAYLAAKQGISAAAEFQKIIDHPGLVVNEPIGALAQLGLSKAYVLSHDTTKAKTWYQNFPWLWKDADPTTPFTSEPK
jgi:eukaryotic-like serine/threonine-protein kinase